MSLLDFFRPEWKNSDYSVRVKAVERVSDQAVLKRIAITTKDYIIGKIALEKISDQEILKSIATNSKEPNIRNIAIGKITNHAFIEKLIQNEVDLDSKRSVIEKLTNQQILIKIALNDKNESIREMSVQNIVDENVLTEIAKNDESNIVGQTAFNKITNVTIRASIKKHNKQKSNNCEIKLGDFGLLKFGKVEGVWTQDEPNFEKIQQFLKNLESQKFIKLLINISDFVSFNCDSHRVSDYTGGGYWTLLKPINNNLGFITHGSDINFKYKEICELKVSPSELKEKFELENP
jgi:phage terminase small subunit